jgi:hypothetical protein
MSLLISLGLQVQRLLLHPSPSVAAKVGMAGAQRHLPTWLGLRKALVGSCYQGRLSHSRQLHSFRSRPLRTRPRRLLLGQLHWGTRRRHNRRHNRRRRRVHLNPRVMIRSPTWRACFRVCHVWHCLGVGEDVWVKELRYMHQFVGWGVGKRWWM